MSPKVVRSAVRHRQQALVPPLFWRSLTVGAAATAVVAGSATGVLATPSSAPLAELAVSEVFAPVLHGKAAAAGSGAQSIRFSARTVGASHWDLLDAVSTAGTDAYRALPEGRLSVGQAFEYLVAHCDDTGCTDSGIKSGIVSPALGAGERPGATRVPFTIGDRIGAQVDVGSGNLLVTTNLLSLPRRSGSPLDVGLAYNSTTRASGESHFLNSVGSSGSGWRLSTARDVRLELDPGTGMVVYSGANGLTGTFTPKAGGGFIAPPGMKMTLTAVSGGWTLVDHGSGDTSHFATNGRMNKLVDRNGNATTFTYNPAGGLTEIRSDQGSAGASTLAVELGGTTPRQIAALRQNTGGQTRAVTFTYDPDRNVPTSVTDAEGRVTEFFYGTGGNLNRITAPGGAVTSFTYDGIGRVMTITQPTASSPTGAVTRFAYPDGKTIVADPNTNLGMSIYDVPRTTYEYTADGRKLIAKVTDPAGHERSATYTPQLDIATSANPAGTSTFGYDPAVNDGQSLTSTQSATGAGSSFAYANTAAATRYQPSSSTDTQGQSSTYTYSGAGNRLSASNASSTQASVTYNNDGTVATATSPSGAVTTYAYDATGQLISITPPAGNSLAARNYTYDGYGRVATYTSGRGVIQTYRYDDLDRILEVDYSDATPTVSYTYDDAGSIDSRTDVSGATTYDYDPLGRLTARSHTANSSGGVSYSYDKAGNLATARNAAGTTTYSYDSRNLVTRAASPSGRVIDFTHDPSGKRTDTRFNTTTGTPYPGTVTPTSFAAHTHTDFDASGQVSRVWTSRAGNDNDRVSDLTYSYASPGSAACANAPASGTATSLRWAMTDNRTGKVTNYCYDRAGRLLTATTAGGETWAYTYDGNGNRTQTRKNGAVVQTLAVNTADQLTTTGYGYDASGNLTAATGVGTSLGYNGAEHMTSRTTPGDGYSGGGTATYTYAGTDQTELISQSGLFDYTYGRTNSAGLPILESYTKGGSTYSYVYDPQGTPLAFEGSNDHYLALDGLGSPVALINQSGTQTGAYSYDPYGQATATPLNNSGAIDVQIYGYAGGYDDPNTRLVHFGHRWYDPAIGRFTQQDSIETLADPSRANRYEYAGGNPINYVDPTGQDFWDVLEVGGEVLGAAVGCGTGVVAATETGITTAATAAAGGVGTAVAVVGSCAFGAGVALAGGEIG